jgi:23S rRNA pseudouridine2604 synthase
LHAKVPNNISAYFENARQLAIAGRLDKDSEGLLLLSNDGKWVEEMCNPKQEKEKEYLVELAQMPNLAFVNQFENGVLLGGDYKTKPCSCEIIEGTTIKVILKEGKNRQIRRMCHKLGYTVVSLLRTRINDQMLNELNPGQVEQFFPKEAD